MADLDLRAGRIEDAAGAPARGSSSSPRGPATGSTCSTACDVCGYLCAATGRHAEAVTIWAAHAALDPGRGAARLTPEEARRRESRCARPGRRSGLTGPARPRTRGAAMSLATAAEYALMLTDPGPHQPRAPGPGTAERPGTGTGHPGRPGPHRRRHRRAAVHQHPHRPLPPGPDPGQDRLPPPRRPDPPGPDRRPGLTSAQRNNRAQTPDPVHARA